VKWQLAAGGAILAAVLIQVGRKSLKIYRRRDFDASIRTPPDEFERQQEDE
jgi:hypothetical protein